MALLHLNIVIRLDPVFGGAESDGNTRYVATVFPDLGLENSLILVAKRPKLELLLAAGAKLLNAEDTTLDRSVTARVKQLVYGPSWRSHVECIGSSMGARCRAQQHQSVASLNGIRC